MVWGMSGGFSEFANYLEFVANPQISRLFWEFQTGLWCQWHDCRRCLIAEGQRCQYLIAFFSIKLNSAQCNYSIIEKELLSLILGLEHFAFYLGTSETVTVYSDHRPLQYLSSFKTKNPRLTHRSLYLQNFNLEIVHDKGTNNVLPDWLFRPSIS